MKVTNTNITDQELAEVLSQAGMGEIQIKAFLSGCSGKECCADKVRILRNTRRSLLDSIHKKQTLLDKLDYVLWCMEHQESEGSA